MARRLGLDDAVECLYALRKLMERETDGLVRRQIADRIMEAKGFVLRNWAGDQQTLDAILRGTNGVPPRAAAIEERLKTDPDGLRQETADRLSTYAAKQLR